MADTDTDNESSDDWFEPEELRLSTTNLPIPHPINFQVNNENKDHNNKDNDLNNNNNNNQLNNDNKINNMNDQHKNGAIVNPNKPLNNTNDNDDDPPPAYVSPSPQPQPQSQSKSQPQSQQSQTVVNISNSKQITNKMFNPELNKAFEMIRNSNNATNNNNNTNNDNNNNTVTASANNSTSYDIDGLPVNLNGTPVLSLKTLSQNSNNKPKDNNNTKDKKQSFKNKYSKFFIKNFFLKKFNDNNDNDNNDNDNDIDNKNDNNLNANTNNTNNNILINKIKMKGNSKDRAMNDLRLTQKIENAHSGAIYCMEFSKKGDYLATGGQDSVLRIWTVCGSSADIKRNTLIDNNNCDYSTIISIVAFREFTGHRADIIDISWSNGEFILSASIDQTVMLWHTSRPRCLCLFQHSDIVTSVKFHPTEDYLFLSGSFDSRLRLWNILEHRVIDWVQVPTLVTSTTFSLNGKYAVAGLYDGQCFFYHTNGYRLKYVTAIECRNGSGKYRKGRKVTGLSYLPIINDISASLSSSRPNTNINDNNNNDNNDIKEHGSVSLLITTNDSRLRLYNLSNFDMKCKYKGHENTESQIHARFSPDGKLIICGSEDNNIYIWKVEKSLINETTYLFNTKKNKNRQEYYEYFKSNSKLPQVALFAPHRTIHYIYKYRNIINKQSSLYQNNEDKIKHIILTADTEGQINIYTNHSNDPNFKYQYHHHTKTKGKKKK